MDVTASAITVISSVWTLTINLKTLIEGIKNAEAKVRELERKATGFTTIITQIKSTYRPEATINVDQKIREAVQTELSHCEEDLKRYNKEASKLLGQREIGRYGAHLILNTWRERVAKPTFEAIEKSIADHQSNLQSLMQIHHGHKLDETGNDLKQVSIAISRMHDKIESLVRAQALDGQDTVVAGGVRRLERRASDITLVNPHEDTDAERVTINERGNPDALHSLFQEFLEGLLRHMASQQGSISLPSGSPLGGTDPNVGQKNPYSEAYRYETQDSREQLRKPSFDGKAPKGPSSIERWTSKQRSDAALDGPSLSSLQKIATTRSMSPLSESSTLAQTNSSGRTILEDEGEDLAEQKDTYSAVDVGLNTRTNKDMGAELLQAVKNGTMEDFQRLISTDASLEEKDEKGKTPLIVAASSGKVDMANQLLRHGADIQAVDNKQATALHSAIESSAWSVMSLLLQPQHIANVASIGKGPPHIDVNVSDKRGRTPLHSCTLLAGAEDNMKEAVQQLMASNANIDAKDGAKVPPVYYAIKHRRYSVVALFLERGADLTFERPETSDEIGKLLDDHLTGKVSSPTFTATKMRRDSTKSPKERKGSFAFSIGRRKSAPNT